MMGRLPGLGRRGRPRARRELLRAVRPRRDAGRPPGRHLLGRHAPAPRPRRQPGRPPAGDLPRRADDRASTRAAARRCGTSIAGLAGAGVTVFLTTQYLEEADRLADRIAVIDGGRDRRRGHGRRAQAAGRRPAARPRPRRRGRLRRGRRARSTAARSRRDPAGRVARRRHRRQRRPRARAARRGRPGGDAVARFAVHGATLDDVFLALTGEHERTMSEIALTMAGRCLRLSLRHIDALLTSLLLPVMLMLVFVYLFGGAIETGTRLRHLRRPRRAAAVRRLRRGDHRGERQPGHDRRDRRPVPLDGRRRAGGARRPRRGERGAQRASTAAGARRRAGDRVPARRRAARLARRGGHAAGLRRRDLVARGRDRPARQLARGGQRRSRSS